MLSEIAIDDTVTSELWQTTSQSLGSLQFKAKKVGSVVCLSCAENILKGILFKHKGDLTADFEYTLSLFTGFVM